MRKAVPQRFAFSTGTNQAQEGCLSLWVCVPKGDLGNPKRTTWAVRTDELLSKDTCDHNVVIRPIKYVDFTGL